MISHLVSIQSVRVVAVIAFHIGLEDKTSKASLCRSQRGGKQQDLQEHALDDFQALHRHLGVTFTYVNIS